MEHAEVVRTQLVERFLLGELSAAQEDEFVQHFFDCDECASDVRLTAQFLDTTKKVLATDRAAAPRAAQRSSRWMWAPYSVAASIVLLAFTLYQNLVTIPVLQAKANPQAQALTAFSLAGMGARSGGATVVSPSPGKSFVLTFDIPPHDNISQYRCQILSNGGSPVVSIDVSEDAASNTVLLWIPASVLKAGEYQFSISGRSKVDTSFTQLERYPLQVSPHQ